MHVVCFSAGAESRDKRTRNEIDEETVKVRCCSDVKFCQNSHVYRIPSNIGQVCEEMSIDSIVATRCVL